MKKGEMENGIKMGERRNHDFLIIVPINLCKASEPQN